MDYLNYRYPNPDSSLAQMPGNGYDRAMTNPERIPLQVGTTDLAIGEYSVGVPPARTCDELVEAYIELVYLVRRDYPEYFREEDFVALAEATTQECSYFRNRAVAEIQLARVAS